MKYKLRDKVEIKKTGYGGGGHRFKKGDIVTITRVSSEYYKASKGEEYWFIDDSDLKFIQKKNRQICKHDWKQALTAREFRDGRLSVILYCLKCKKYKEEFFEPLEDTNE